MKLTTFVFALSVLWPPALAQRPPATQLKKLEPLIGNWQVSGTLKPTADGEDIPWTAQQSYRWVLRGHFLKEEMIVNLGDAMPAFASISFTGWDDETQGYVSFQVSNDGNLASVETFVADDDTILTARTRLREGQLVVERGVTKLGDGTYRFETQAAIGDGPFFTLLQGSARRTAAAGSALEVEASASMAPPAPEMAVLGKMSGEYRFGPPEVENPWGTATVRLIFGGTVQVHQFRGAQEETVGLRYIAWSPADNCYNAISFVGNGESSKTQLRQVDDRTFVDDGRFVRADQPTFWRLFLTCDAQGSLAQMGIDSSVGTEEAQRLQSVRFRKTR